MDPKLSMWLNIAASVASALLGAASLFTDIFGQGMAQKIMAGVGLAGLVLAGINAGLHGYTQPPNTTVLTVSDTKVDEKKTVAKKVLALLFALFLVGLKKSMFLLALLSAVALSACAALDTGATIVSSTVNPNYASAAVQSFAAIESTADAYLRLPKCGTTSSAICQNPTATAQIVPLIRTGFTAVKAVRAALHASNGGPIPVASYQTLTAITDTLNSVYANYNISK